MKAGVKVSEILEEIKLHIGKLLRELNVSQAELARRIGKSRAYVNQRITGNTNIQITDLDEFSRALGIPIRDLLPEPQPIDISELSLVDLIKHIFKEEIEKYIDQIKST